MLCQAEYNIWKSKSFQNSLESFKNFKNSLMPVTNLENRGNIQIVQKIVFFPFFSSFYAPNNDVKERPKKIHLHLNTLK